MDEERVSLRDIYSAVNRIEDKFDKRLDEMDREIANVKSFQNKTLGVLTAVSIFIGGFSSFVWDKILGKH